MRSARPPKTDLKEPSCLGFQLIGLSDWSQDGYIMQSDEDEAKPGVHQRPVDHLCKLAMKKRALVGVVKDQGHPHGAVNILD